LKRDRFIDVGFKVIKRNVPEVEDGKEDFVCILFKFLFTGTEIDLILEYKSTKLVRASTTKQVQFLSLSVFFGRMLARMTY